MTHIDTEDLAEVHVIDRTGMVWRVVRDGGMATRAHYAGIISIGIATLDREAGPLVTLAAYVAARVDAARRDADAQIAAVRELAEKLLAAHADVVMDTQEDRDLHAKLIAIFAAALAVSDPTQPDPQEQP